MAEEVVKRYFGRVLGEHFPAQHLASGEGGVGHLQQQETDQVIALDLVEAKDNPAGYCHARGDK